ncbi:MAG: acyl carrier protein [Paludibacteraceae bacterium]|nr:acyl carrier protein [Paludibacteraceae bacterium]
MEKTELIEKVNQILVDEFEVEPEVITPDANIKQALQLDSLSIVDMVALIEGEFKVKIKASEVSKLTTFQLLYDYIYEHYEG